MNKPPFGVTSTEVAIICRDLGNSRDSRCSGRCHLLHFLYLPTVDIESQIEESISLKKKKPTVGTIFYIWGFPKMVVPPKHHKMMIFSRKTHGCWVPPL